jgi:hypothetical protein
MIVQRPAHEELLLELSEEAYALWRHSPITAAYLKYLGDQAEAFRTAAADLLEAGALAPQADVIRGRLLNLRELQTLSLGVIKNFYRREDTQENDGTETNQGNPG